MPNKEQIVKAMDEWLSTKGLHPAEVGMIDQLRTVAEYGWPSFRASALMFRETMPDIVISAVTKARKQGKCKEWPQ